MLGAWVLVPNFSRAVKLCWSLLAAAGWSEMTIIIPGDHLHRLGELLLSREFQERRSISCLLLSPMASRETATTTRLKVETATLRLQEALTKIIEEKRLLVVPRDPLLISTLLSIPVLSIATGEVAVQVLTKNEVGVSGLSTMRGPGSTPIRLKR
jgi:hypothetical protein